MSRDLDVRGLLEREAVETLFQPIFAVRSAELKGVEALSRGRREDGTLVAPEALFRAAAAQGLTTELDRLCWHKALERFAPLHQLGGDLVLFVNVHAATAAELFGPGGVVARSQHLNLDPRAVAVELLESRFDDTARLRALAGTLRRLGFLVVLDDMGTGHSNLERVLHVQPDILKVDRSLVRGLHENFYQREVFRALVGLSEKVGGWVIAEGVETPAEALVALGLQADLMQGLLFARPAPAEDLQSGTDVPAAVRQVATEFRRTALAQADEQRSQRERRAAVARSFATGLEGRAAEAFEPLLVAYAGRHPSVESASVLDAAGVQVTETVWSPRNAEAPKALIFRPPGKGTSHALKEYVYLLAAGGPDPFETSPYVPLPTGSLCVALSTRFRGAGGESFILCLHLNVDELRRSKVL